MNKEYGYGKAILTIGLYIILGAGFYQLCQTYQKGVSAAYLQGYSDANDMCNTRIARIKKQIPTGAIVYE